MIKIIVTGGLGFIGSSFINLCSKNKSIFILNLDNETYASDKKRIKIKEKNNYRYKKLNINNLKILENTILKFKPNLIVNFAAETHVDNSIKNSENFFNTNIKGVYNILEVVKKEPSIGLIQISTDEVYGDVLRGYSKEDTSLIKPSSPYSASKASAEHLIRSYIRTYKINAIILRPCNAFGPDQHYEKLIPNSCRKLLKNKPITIYGSGKNIREWIYVNDLAKIIKKITTNFKIYKGETFNISTNYFLNNIQMTKLICNTMKKKPFKNYFIFVEDRKGHDFRYANDNKKIIRKLKLGKNWSNDTKKNLIKTIKSICSNV